jgi:uncharacterized protein (DUF2236 family)
MEVAHPAVAAAVAEHSQFQRRPFTRAWATADVALRLVYGNAQVARDAVRQVYKVHDHINGHADGHTNEYGAGAYTAHDASLLAWVWATLVDTSEAAFTRWVRPFTTAEAEAFYTEMRSFGRFFGIPDRLLPVDRPAFARYVEDTLRSDAFGTSPASQELARQVLWFRHRTVPPPVVRLERVLALATLDHRLVESLDLGAPAGDLELGRKVDRWMTSYYGRLPRRPRVLPALYVLARRPSIGLAGRLGALIRPS